MKKYFKYLVVLLVSSSAFAQKNVNSHTFAFSDTLETVQVEDALGPKSEMADHQFLFRSAYDFVNESLIGIDPTHSAQKFTVVKRLHSLSTGLGWMASPRLLIGFDLPISYIRLDRTYLTTYSLTEDTTAWKLGDVGLHIKYRLTPDDTKVNVAIMPYVAFPTGSKKYFVSDDSYVFGGKILADTIVFNDILSLYANAGYTFANNAQFLNIDRSKRVELAAGAYAIVFGEKLGINAEVISGITFPGFKDNQNPIALRLGFQTKAGPVHFYLGGALEGLQTAKSDDISLYAGLKVPFGSKKMKDVTQTQSQQETITVEKKIEILKENLSVHREINFETGKDVILESSYEELNSAAQIINKYVQNIKLITIEGHTDSRGSDKENMILSQRRADAVKQYLVKKGIPAKKLKAIGYGETRPKVKETGPETQLMNRRVEFKVNEQIETKNDVSVSNIKSVPKKKKA